MKHIQLSRNNCVNYGNACHAVPIMLYLASLFKTWLILFKNILQDNS